MFVSKPVYSAATLSFKWIINDFSLSMNFTDFIKIFTLIEEYFYLQAFEYLFHL